MIFGGAQQDAQWRALARKAGETSLNMGIWLGRAQPVELDADGILLIEFEPGADSAFAFFQAPENQAALDSFLKEETDNVRSFRARQAPPAEASETMPEPKRKNAPVTDDAPRRDFNLLLEDTGIAAVVNEFKGVIVDVQSPQGEYKKHT